MSNNDSLQKSDLRLGVVDEHGDDVLEFFRYFEKYFVPVEIEIGINPEDAIQDIISKNVDAVAIDYLLKEHNDQVLYNGNDLFKKIKQELKGFPCFLMTSYPDQALNHNIDAFRIFSKKIMQPDPEKKVEFKDGQELVARIKHSIVNYEEEKQLNENRITELIQISQERELTHPEEQELIELDTFFERIYDNTHAIPEDLKTITNDQRLSELLSKVDELISKIDEKK